MKREETDLIRKYRQLLYASYSCSAWCFLTNRTEEQRLSLSNTFPAGPKLMQYFLVTLL